MTEWLDLDDAVELIRGARKLSVGAAVKLLIEACAEGVRARQRPCWGQGDFGFLIPAAIWRDAHLDIDTGELYPAGTDPHNPPTEEGGFGYGGNGIIEVSATDLRWWLQVKPESKRKRVQPKRDPAAQAISALWPEGVPSQSALPNKRLVERVTNHLRKNEVVVPIGPDTILRAAGRKIS
jgi:hypothetical protein